MIQRLFRPKWSGQKTKNSPYYGEQIDLLSPRKFPNYSVQIQIVWRYSTHCPGAIFTKTTCLWSTVIAYRTIAKTEYQAEMRYWRLPTSVAWKHLPPRRFRKSPVCFAQILSRTIYPMITRSRFDFWENQPKTVVRLAQISRLLLLISDIVSVTGEHRSSLSNKVNC